MSQLFASSGQNIGTSASATVLPMNIGIIKPKGFISFRMDWFDLLAVQGTLKSLLQFKSIKSSALNVLYSPTLTSIQEKGKSKLQ